MSINMDWLCVVTQVGKYLHTALGYTAEDAKQKAGVWREKHIDEYPSAVVGESRLQFPKSA